MTDEVKVAIEETVERARTLLFDDKGKLRPEGYFITLFTLQTVVRPATVDEVMHPRPGHYIFDWRGTTYLYNAGLGEILLDGARSDTFCDQVLCNAAASMLDATCGILEPRLRAYVCGRLTGTIPSIKAKRGQPSKNWGRNAVIVGRLIPPLLNRFEATRNRATKHTESACSIVHKALSRLHAINLDEKRIEGIWEKRKHLVLT